MSIGWGIPRRRLLCRRLMIQFPVVVRLARLDRFCILGSDLERFPERCWVRLSSLVQVVLARGEEVIFV